MRKALIVSALSLVAALAVSGCVLAGPGNKTFYFNGTPVGELDAQSGGLHGYLVTLYAPITSAIRAFHDGKISLNDGHSPAHTWNCGAYPPGERDACDLRWLHTFDGTAEWTRATAAHEAGDFHDALTGMQHPGYDCLAVQITPGGENWTNRHKSESSCTP